MTCPDCKSPYPDADGAIMHHAWCNTLPDVVDSRDMMPAIVAGVVGGLLAWLIVGLLIALGCVFAAHHPSSHSVFVVFLLATVGYLITLPTHRKG